MDEVQELLASAARLFKDELGPQTRERCEGGEWPDELWASVEAMGFPLAMVDEERGGVGLDRRAAFQLMTVVGRHAVPLPLSESMIAAWLLGLAGRDIPSGPLSLACLGAQDSVKARRDGGRTLLSGKVHRVPWGRNVQCIVMVAEGTEGPLLVEVDPRHAEMEHGRNLAGEPRDTLTFNDTPAAQACASPVSPAVVRSALAVCRSMQISGACETILELSCDYANLRMQFGRPISKFQAVQHALATAATHAVAASAAASQGADAADCGFDLLAVAAAKIRTGEAAGSVASIAHQTFGAIGFTREHTLHYFTKRLWSWRDECGDEAHWAALLGRSLFASGGAQLWPRLTAKGDAWSI